MNGEQKVKCHCGVSGHALCWLGSLFLVVLIIASIFLIRNWDKSYDYIGVGEIRDTITLEGMGKVTAIPDIATFTVGVQTEKKDVTAAQKENTEKMNNITKALKDLGIEDEDIKTTNYRIYPRYDWKEGERTLKGYQVDQTVTVKVRDLDKVGEILNQAGQLGANSIGGINFTIDDPEVYKQEARLKALENAQEKAEALAKAAGVKLGKVVGFSESEAGTSYPYRDYALGLGGLEVPKEAAAPEISAGSLEVIIYATVSYEVF